MVKMLEGQGRGTKKSALKHYEILELWEFERGTDEAFAVRSVLGEPLEDKSALPLSQLPLVIVGYDQQKILSHLHEQRAQPQSALRPIAVVGINADYLEPEVERLADIVLPPRPGLEELQDTAISLETLAMHLRQLKLAPQDPAMTMMQFLYSRRRAIQPAVDAGSHIAYRFSLAEAMLNMPTRESQEILEELAERGLLESSHVDKLFTCPDCEGYRVAVKELCPECDSSNLSTEESIHHFRCGHVAPESEFVVEGQRQCPKCHGGIRHIGVEYNRPGRFSVCRECHFWASEPLLAAWCADCNRYHSPAELHSVNIRAYSISSTGANVAARGNWNPSAAIAGPDTDGAGLSALYAEELAKRVIDIAEGSGRSMTVLRAAVVDAGDMQTSLDGDLLGEIRSVMREMLRDQDVIVNTGDNEFLILLPEGGAPCPDGEELEAYAAQRLGVTLMITGIDGRQPYSMAVNR